MIDRLTDASWQLVVGASAVLILGSRLSGNLRSWLWRLVAAKAVLALVFVLPLAWLAAETPVALDGTLPTTSFPSSPPIVSNAQPVDPWIWIWAVGACVAFLVMARSVWAAEQLARRASAVGGVRAARGCQIVVSGAVPAPMIVGPVRPTILLPDDPSLDLALAHELAHAGRSDLRWHLAMCLARSVFWFHPCAWLMVSEHRQACEEACDSEVVKTTGASPRHYAETLLRFAAVPVPAVAALASSTSTLKRRLHSMHRSKIHPGFVVAATLASLLFMVPAQLVAANMAIADIPSGGSLDQTAWNLIGRPVVAKEIGLTEDQRQKVEAVVRADEDTLRVIGNRMAEMKEKGVPDKERIAWENRSKADFYAKVAADALSVLTASQRDRLRQLALQVVGPVALGATPLGKQAGLMQAKIDAIAEIAKENRQQEIRLSVQRAHESMERFRQGLNLSGPDQDRFRALQEKQSRFWSSKESMRLQADLRAARGTDRYPKAYEAYSLWLRTSPDRMTQAENAEYERFLPLASKDTKFEADSARYEQMFRYGRAEANRKALALLSATEVKRWDAMQGRRLTFGDPRSP